jgi:hypothetical protein
MTAPKSSGPDCRHLGVRIHSRYPRTLAALPWATAPLQLRLIGRRFLCPTCPCGRQTCSERLPTGAPMSARTTTRLAQAQAHTGLALGGAAGARHLTRQGVPGSRQTLLRRGRRLATPEGPAPPVVGLDDWAGRKGHRYGTIVVDLTRGCPMDVLADRLAEPVATWLKAPPDVQIVARDRAEPLPPASDREHRMPCRWPIGSTSFSTARRPSHRSSVRLTRSGRRSMRRSAGPAMSRSGRCPARAGRPRRSGGRSGAARARSRSTWGRPPLPNTSSPTAGNAACCAPTSLISGSDGTAVVGTPGACVRRSNRRGTPGARPPWPAIRSA